MSIIDEFIDLKVEEKLDEMGKNLKSQSIDEIIDSKLAEKISESVPAIAKGRRRRASRLDGRSRRTERRDAAIDGGGSSRDVRNVGGVASSWAKLMPREVRRGKRPEIYPAPALRENRQARPLPASRSLRVETHI